MAGKARAAWLVLPVIALYFVAALARIDVPGPYMDAVNPDYLIARVLAPDWRNVPVWVLPGNLLFHRFPVLIQLYHGALPYYLTAPFYLAFGTGIEGIRIANAALGAMVLLALHAFLRAFAVPLWAALPVLAVLALDPAFTLSFRTQFGITLLPMAFLLLSPALLQADGPPARWRILASGVAAGLSVYGYFIYAFLALPVAAFAMWRLANGRARIAWLLGAAAGASGYAAGVLLGIVSAGGVPVFLARLGATVHALDPGQSSLPLTDRLALFGSLARLALTSDGNLRMMLNAGSPAPAAGLFLMAAVVPAGLLLARRGPAIPLLLGIVLGYLLLVLTFGDRLWAHHLSGLVVVAHGLLACVLAALPMRSAARPLALAIALAPLLALNLGQRAHALERLAQTGGVGLSSDAITRFARHMDAMRPRPVVFTPDWGVMMPLSLLTRGAFPVIDGFLPEAARARLCGGDDIVVAAVVTEATTATGAHEARVAAWGEAIGWGAPERQAFAQRGGEPVLVALTWRASARPAARC